jgi:hypothetical protein
MNMSETVNSPEMLAAIHELVTEVRDMLAERREVKEFYSIADLAKHLRKAEFTVREWCRLRRINAEKRRSGRGRSHEWVVSHAELLRIEKEGLLPLRLEH